MPRPKGSKNRVKKVGQPVSQVEEKLAAQLDAKKALEDEMAQIAAEIEKQKQLLKDKKKDLRAADKAIAALEAKKAEEAAIADAAAKKAEIEQVVTRLVSSGRSAEEILDLLKQ